MIKDISALHQLSVLYFPFSEATPNKQTLRDFETQCLPPPAYTAEMIRRLRENLHISQAVFAAYLNASISTVQKWENGDKKPSGAAARLLSVIERKGLEVLA